MPDDRYTSTDDAQAQPGLTFSQQAMVKSLARQIVHTIQLQTDDPRVAFVTLLNVTASLIGTQFPPREIQERTTTFVTYLPLYVNAYISKEKKL